MDTEPPTPTAPPRKRERPLLQPNCRKLRHLQSISLRNLSLHPPPPKGHAHSVDDEELKTSWKSKALLRLEGAVGTGSLGGGLMHSKSSTNLAAQVSNVGGLGEDVPRIEKPRDKREVETERLVDCFFTLHAGGSEGCGDVDRPVYISEVVKKSLNPSFQSFDLSGTGPYLSRLDAVVVKIWVDPDGAGRWILLTELTIALRYLQYIGTQLENFRHPLPPNSIIFHLTDGCYTSFNDLPPSITSEPPPLPTTKEPRETSSYDALLKLKDLSECILDASLTQQRLSEQITTILTAQSTAITQQQSLSERRNAHAKTLAGLERTKKRLAASISRRDKLQSSIRARREFLKLGRDSQRTALSHLSSARTALASSHQLLTVTHESLTSARRRIISDLSTIYPILPPPPPPRSSPLSFTIRGLPLPTHPPPFTPSAFPAGLPPIHVLNAALGHVSHLLHLLSLYLLIPLRYPLHPMSSTSSIRDEIGDLRFTTRSSSAAAQQPKQNRSFPLYIQRWGAEGTGGLRFEYAYFLLGKDVEQLLAGRGVRVLDVRCVGGNLANLVYLVGEGRNPEAGRAGREDTRAK
ncbi:hypothetical protein BJ508DRAFT_370670 [Ascobolus immersus RN42]|uniref:Autophagy-related protein 14 n=1 Tax=Ascobolus immersus RN42 TaxID=1160509 RepID=A0A3N4HRX4_ASCIM|nr:hypothetical protein BJ508DRAFT_370670 [Ascobolus immersus RN42]